MVGPPVVEVSKVCAGTGHRPPRLGLSYGPEGNRVLTGFVLSELRARPWVAGVVSGMAQGFDQALAHAALLLGLPLTCALPFEGQEARWPDDARRRYDAIIRRAARVEVVCPGGYANRKYADRDRWMVENSQGVLALWDGEPGSGTALTVAHAYSLGVPVANLWAAWAVYVP